ncbi:putative iduronate 2-sulfatase-like [Apostichopus japonicus]|uniref:Iduronate 2-sulfatase n=1 Tax=Stichopus japonicus TaxID=307972 RepID=A0A2G8L8C1_STIJA|nr:putative iduronate 2-sulfatase-like [Apostichopus japonicus]
MPQMFCQVAIHICECFVPYAGKLRRFFLHPAEGRPNVLFLVVDDLRPELGCYGSPVITPNIDQLAIQSIRFTNAHAQQALCAPSRASFLTSRRPDTTKVYDLDTYWRNAGGNFTTLPQYFKENGYFTASMGKVFHNGTASNETDDYPYSWSVPAYHPSTTKYKRKKVCLSPDGTRHEYLLCPVDVSQQPEGTLPDIQLADNAISMIRNMSSGLKSTNASSHLPFFLGLGFYKPHVPFKFPKEFLSLYPIETIKMATNKNLPASLPDVAFETYSSLREREDIAALNLSFPYGPMPDKYHLLIRQHYYAAVSYVDAMIGRVLNALEQSSLADNTIIVLIGDHGWQLGEHSEFAKFSNYALATRVPLLIHVPPLLKTSFYQKKLTTFHFQDVFQNMPQQTEGSGKVSNAFVELVDIFPTIVDLAGLPSVSECPSVSHEIQLCTEGTSLLPLIKPVSAGAESMWKNCTFSQYPRPDIQPKNNTDVPKLKDIRIMGYTLQTKYYRFAEWLGFDTNTSKPDWSNVYARELYDLEKDVEENNNVADEPQYQLIIKNLTKALQKGWRNCKPL